MQGRNRDADIDNGLVDTGRRREWDELRIAEAAHSSIPAWRIPWTEEPGGLQSMGLQRVGHD